MGNQGSKTIRHNHRQQPKFDKYLSNICMKGNRKLTVQIKEKS